MSNNKFKVLVVEDEANICSFIYTLLETNGYQTFVAPSCELGRVDVRFLQPRPDHPRPRSA